MNKSLLFTIAVVLAAAIAAGVYFSSGESAPPSTVTDRRPVIEKPIVAPTPEPPKENDTTAQSLGDLKEAPAIIVSAKPLEDDSTWVKTTTRTGVTLTAPIKGSNAPTWTYTVLAKDDVHLQGNCYVTDATVYKRTNFSSFENACQTTTELSDGPGTRTDYFVFGGDKINMFTFTKTYSKGFDMNGYSAILEKIINIID